MKRPSFPVLPSWWRHRLGMSLMIVLVSCQSNPPSEDWINLFNGTDLTGWKGDPNVWRSKNGYISGKAALVKQNTF